MNQGMLSAARPLSVSAPHFHPSCISLFRSSKVVRVPKFSTFCERQTLLCCTKLDPWEPLPVTCAPADDRSENFLKRTNNIFETLGSEDTTEVLPGNNEVTDTRNEAGMQLQFLKWPMWLLGPSLLLTTGMVPSLWLPISSVFLGANVASLFSLIGLDCIYNLGATLFLLMADACARPKHPNQVCYSKAPFSYQFWNMVANITGFVIPLMMFYGSQVGLFQPQLPFVPFAVLLGPYLLLLAVQILTEMLTWHWQSPVWLVTPVVYEAYRILQLMRGLKLGAELSAPAWMMHSIRGLVSWWVLILGVQLMRVAWFAGASAQSSKQKSSSPAVA